MLTVTRPYVVQFTQNTDGSVSIPGEDMFAVPLSGVFVPLAFLTNISLPSGVNTDEC